MENSISENHPSPIQNKQINLELARIRVTRWLTAMREVLGAKTPPQDIPRALFISLEDIKELVKAYPEKDLKGIRVYFGLAGETIPGPANIKDLRGLIVPVLKEDKGRPHADLVFVNSVNPNDTSIYDFTTPCPTYCDLQSELYVEMPSFNKN